MLIHGLPGGFRDAGCEVEISGPLSLEIIETLLTQFRPDVVFTMGWSNETTDKKAFLIHKLVKAAKLPLVYWATEDPTHTHSFTLPLIQKLQPDFVFTICRERVAYYKKLGIRAAHMDFGYHPGIHFQTDPNAQYCCNVAVVANAYPRILQKYPQHYRIESLKTLIVPLVQSDIRVDFWGKGWNEIEPVLGIRIPRECCHGYLEYCDANLVYSSASILLGPQNQQTQLSQRTYEIMGSGGFLLTSDTPEVRRLFVPGKDLVTSASPEETVELTRHYLKETAERQKIRASGQKAVSAHTYQNRALDMLRILNEEKIFY